MRARLKQMTRLCTGAGQRKLWLKRAAAVTALMICAPLMSTGLLARPGLALVSDLTQKSTERPLRIAVFGRDDRQPAANNRWSDLRRSIGGLKNLRNGRMCTAVCIASDLIVTAGHCFAQPGSRGKAGRGQFQLGQSENRPGKRRTSAIATAVALGTAQLRTTAPINAAEDWALAKLSSPVCKNSELAINPLPAGDSRWQKPVLAAYHEDRGATLLLSDGCSAHAARPSPDFKPSGKMIFHDCDTAAGSSGAPLLVSGPHGPEIIAISTGTFVETRIETSRTGPQASGERTPVANTAVDASAFLEAFNALHKAGDRDR